MFPRRLLLACAAVLLLLAPSLHAQVQVQLKIARHLFMCYEPIIATVSITNLTGRDLTLADQPPEKWFGFDILNSEDSPVPPRATEYHLEPLTIPAGETVKRSVNLVNLYPVTDFGTYRVRAAIFVSVLNRYVSSLPVPIEVSEGKTLWQQTVGIPDGQQNAGQYRSYELLSFRQLKDNVLYLRVEDRDAGTVYGTYPIGRLINGYDPQVELDSLNQLHVLQMVEPKSYYYTRVGPNAEWLGQQAYIETKTRPHLKKLADGDVNVFGGQVVEEKSQAAANAVVGPKLSDRPAGLPAN
jgi:hypothetical protein